METLEVDVLVLGWGKGGKTLAGALGRAGRRVALVERSAQMYGGTCINIACVPTKALIHQAESRREVDEPDEWFTSSIGKRDSLIDKLRARNHEMLAGIDTVTLVDGQARFVGPHQVAVVAGSEELRINAGTVVVNTGSFPATPPIEGAAESTRIYDSTTLQQVDPLPRRLVIIGGGYVGLEFAGMFAHFGSSVTVVDRNDAMLRREDRDVAEMAKDLLAEQGVRFVLGADVASIRDQLEDTIVAVTGSDTADEIPADAVLLATGRTPATADLGLDAAGIKTDERGYIVVDEHLRTSVPHVFALGDVNGGPQFTYISQARDLGRDVLIAAKKVADIAAMPRPKIVGDAHGLIKFVVDAGTDKILGATLFCVDSQDVINLVALAMRAGVTATELRDGIWTHPSTTEALNEVLGQFRPLQ